MIIRQEQEQDHGAVKQVTADAFALVEHSDQTEPAIVAALRDAGTLTVSLVAVEGNEIIGHIAFSPVKIDGEDHRWFGLGPVSVRPDRQGRGIGGALIREGLGKLRAQRAAGCVLLGDPAYYGRFGFVNDPALRYPHAPPEYFMRLTFGGVVPAGTVEYHSAFAVQ
jgi:putative acetyltransferase